MVRVDGLIPALDGADSKYWAVRTGQEVGSQSKTVVAARDETTVIFLYRIFD